MFGTIRRIIGSWKGIAYSTSWDNLENEEIFSLLADLVSTNEMDRLLAIIARDDHLSTDNLIEVQFFAKGDGFLFFKDNIHPLMFFRAVNSDL